MTRPIYEPSEQKQIAALGYGSNQLFRRPGQGSSVEWGRADFTTDQTVVSGIGSFLTVVWDNIWVPTGQSFIDQGPSTSIPFSFINDAAWYSVLFWIQFTDSSWTDVRAVEIENTGGGLNLSTPNPHAKTVGGGGANQGGRLYVTGSPLLYGRSGFTQDVRFNVWQTSGTDKTVTSGGVAVLLHGAAGDVTP